MSAPIPSTAFDMRVTGRRETSRVRLGIPAKIILLSGTFPCRVDNMSQTGARIAIGAPPPQRGVDAVLLLDRLELFGAVRWSHSQRFGIEFDQLQPLARVLALRDLADHYAAHEKAQERRMASEFIQGRKGTL